MRVALLFDCYGPYHFARLEACLGMVEVIGVAGGGVSKVYDWKSGGVCVAGVRVVNRDGPGAALVGGEFRRRVRLLLDSDLPDVVAVPGWADRLAFEAVRWAQKRGKAVVMMSETSGLDSPAEGWKGWVRRRLIKLCGSALVGGTPHRKYICDQGMGADKVFTGYDAVGNSYYREDCERWRREDSPRAPYFLASNRFIEKKNLFRLLEAQAGYASGMCDKEAGRRWPLVLLGDGELKGALLVHAERLGLTVVFGAPWEGDVCEAGARTVYFPGFRQIGELPRFYAHAGAFVHASTKEQWGLVVNEAMAAGLPVIVSGRCGCASDLVREGENGYVFEPTDVGELAGLMGRVAGMSEVERAAMGEASRRVIAEWGPERFARGLKAAAEKALEVGPKRAGLVDRMLLEVLCRR
jgi:1,2-diacylglycerol 3-alpha-glucosyltransferase